jgi:L-iditol 2-dehydrogenase
VKACVLTEPGKLEIVEREIRPPGEGEVLVKVDCVGICGTDVGVYRGDHKAKDRVIPGHEYCGEVVETGTGTRRLKPGDYVISEASWGCGTCHWCSRGLPSYCERPQSLGRTVDGAIAQYITVPESILHKSKQSVTPLEGQAGVGVATGLRVVARSGLGVGDRVLIIGPGFSGLLMVQLCRIAGAACVGMAGTRDERLRIAEKLGADFTVNIRSRPQWEEEITAEYARYGFDVCIEASGTESGFLSAIRLVRKGGTIVEFGISSDPLNGVPQEEFYRKEITVVGSKGGYGFYPKAVELLENRRIQVEPVVTHEFPLSESARAFDIADRRLENVLRAVIYPNR